MKACVVIPCLDAEATLSAVIHAARQHVPHIIVVDDGSRDGSAMAAQASGAELHQHATNRGKGAALLTGLTAAHAAGFTHAITMDADGQHLAEDLPTLLESARQTPRALLIGARDFSVPNVPGGSRFGRNFSNWWVHLETRLPLTDTQSGLRVYPVASILALQLGAGRFEWEIEAIVRAAWAGVPVLDVPVSVYYPPASERISHYRAWVDSTRITFKHFRLLGRLALRPVWPIPQVSAK